MSSLLIATAFALGALIVAVIGVRLCERGAIEDLERYKRGEIQSDGIVLPFWRGRRR